MDAWRDIVDWVGGLPFEVARPEEVFDFYRQRGFVLEKLATNGGSLGCNEFVFRKAIASVRPRRAKDTLASMHTRSGRRSLRRPRCYDCRLLDVSVHFTHQ